MPTEDERCEEAKRFQRIEAAFRDGNIQALRAAVDDPAQLPNGPMPLSIGSCLVYAIYHSPLSFIRTLLELGADPNAPVDDGFPPLIAALTCTRPERGVPPRTDVDRIIGFLLEFGADPNQRGINDYTPLHMAVAERNALGIQLLLEGGADPDLRTRIDDYETPVEMAERAGLVEIVRILTRRGKPLEGRLRSGITLMVDVPGDGEPVRRQHRYLLRLRLWHSGGEPVRWSGPSGFVGRSRLEDDGETLITDTRIDRRSLINGLFYGIQGMRVGGTRKLEIAPHMGYGKRGVPGVIPPGAVLTAEITVIEHCEK